MRGLTFYMVSCVVAAVVSYLPWPSASLNHSDAFPGWPSEYEGRVLDSVPLSQREEVFADNFPGKIGKFTDGSRVILMRWVTQPTRKLHPAADCFKAVGYRIRPQAIKKDLDGNVWGSFHGTRANEDLTVQERIHDSAGGSWTDVSSWYWAAVLGRTKGPWWAVTLICRADKQDPH